MSWAPQGNGWASAPAAQDELALRLGQLALRAGAGSDPSHLVSTGGHPPAQASASEHLLSQARQRQLYQGPRVQGMPVQPGVNMPKPARLALGVRGAPTSVPVLNAGLMHAAQLGLGRVGNSAAGPVLGRDRYTGSAPQGIVSPSNQQHQQAALLALVQNQLAAAHMQQQGYAGTIPAVPSVVQQTPPYGQNHATAAANQANMIAAATATAAAQQVASMRNAAALAARTSVGASNPKRHMLGADLSSLGQQHWGANGLAQGVAHGAGVLQNGLQGSWGSQLSLAGTNGAQLRQLARGVGLGHGVGPALNNTVAELGVGNLGHLGVLGQGITSQASPMAGGGLQTAGLFAPSIMASAPMLPILGEDLTKPNVQQKQGVLPGIAPGGLRLMQSAPSALQSAASLDSVKSCETGMTMGSTAGGSPKLRLASDAQKLKAADSAASSAPMAALDVSTLTQAQVNALVSAHAQTEEIRLLAAQFGLLGRPAGASPAVSSGPAVGVPSSSTAPTAAGGSTHRERDVSTLKTLGQMLARTGNTVESAVQTGLLGGCNAEDVKVVWEAYAAELTGMKQAASLGSTWSMELPKGRHLGTSVLPTSNLVAQPTASENVGGVIGDKREAPSQVADQPVMLQSSAAAESTSAGAPALSSAQREIANQTAREEEVEEEPNWDEVFENEEKLVPSQVISAVNDSAADLLTAGLKVPSEGAFNAFSYGFFGGAVDCGGELLEDSLEDLQKPEGGDSDVGNGKQSPAVWETLAQEWEELDSELEKPS